MYEKTAQFRFYEELNDFLPADKRKTSFDYHFNGNPGIKDAIEALGVPHTEVDLIQVKGKSVGFDYQLQHGDRVAVYPVFESLDISPLIRLRAKPLRETKFILDVHLGKLARRLRMLGFDTVYRNDFEDAEIVEKAVNEQRIILTRDQGILKNKAVTHGYWLRSTDPDVQVREVLTRFDLFSQVKPFARCMVCNGEIEETDKNSIKDRIPSKTASFYDEFYICTDCNKIYWKGSHHDNMNDYLDQLIDNYEPSKTRGK
ncbi:Mut7-C ubiquitin/RNAse domain-containing protein [candidate division KSB1 bacterium]|nr:Mut7-C ubiquitin/RNAse domain-containing protein [candidate division KSB1 bacterium]NIR69934.1 Mut7-C ubiquitin/RNAse domain-containing protein [candidate division KSB1 bacterium]NIS25843.1 Mut7-C ubiquitin/RNAse domain-containing protein [candidate division KSB1 bacterium]NIT72718.1 Mut7-C ubiquitin/RNAse domain-containing protein [candidate division KSB1 bacterium]NIU26532.1 Mut7-C ubiquitin/RNAse domain-containing protein [candidate division KSB1 bacterium]